MVKLFSALLALGIVSSLRAASLIPTAPGTNWPYQMIQDLGEGVTLPGSAPGTDGRVHSEVIYRLDGTENIDGQSLLKFEMHRGGVATNTELMTVDDRGIHCSFRIGVDGDRVGLSPAQTVIAAPLKPTMKWDFDGKAGGVEVHQRYAVVAKEDIVVPAGRFHAFHIHAEQTAPDSVTIDRWFVNGMGIVKDITTMRNKEGNLLQRIELNLKEEPKVGPRPEVKPPKKLSVGLSSDAVGNFTTNFSTDTPKIYARWQGHGLPDKARVRAVWIAEDLGDVAPPNYKIDEASAAAAIPEARGVFTLSRPEDGWAPGNYRVEFYVNEELIETVKLKIEQPVRFN